VGIQPLDSMKELLTVEEHQRCVQSPQLGKTWFKMTTDVFVAFLFQVTFLLLHDQFL
jgi:hypothetical protein